MNAELQTTHDGRAPESINALFQRTQFVASYPHLRAMPRESRHEIAFIGRSNSGKSTLINSLCFQKNLARSGRTPGLTRAINVFSWCQEKADDAVNQVPQNANKNEAPEINWIDLPGYGYAQMSKTLAADTGKLLLDYLQKRDRLMALVLIVDSRRMVQALDEEVLSLLPPHINIAIALSKIDKMPRNSLLTLKADLERRLGVPPQSARAVPTATAPAVFLVSSFKTDHKGQEGLQNLRQWLYAQSLLAHSQTELIAERHSEEGA